MTPVTRGEVEAAVEAYGLAVLCQKYPAQPTNPVEAHDHLRSLLTRLFAERDEAVAALAIQPVETRAAFDAMTEAERGMFPLNVQPDGRPRVRLAHIEAGEGAPAGQGTAVVSVPSKYERLAWFMVCAANDARSSLAKIGGSS